MRSEREGFVPCDHDYLNFKGGRFSNSRGAAVDVPYSLSKYDPDPLRFYRTTTAPETRNHAALTYDHSGAIGTWAPSALPAGQALRQPAPLFKKLDERLVDEEYARPEG